MNATAAVAPRAVAEAAAAAKNIMLSSISAHVHARTYERMYVCVCIVLSASTSILMRMHRPYLGVCMYVRMHV